MDNTPVALLLAGFVSATLAVQFTPWLYPLALLFFTLAIMSHNIVQRKLITADIDDLRRRLRKLDSGGDEATGEE